MTHLQFLNQKIFDANKLQEQIQSHENHPKYLSEADIEKECEKTGEVVQSALKIAEDISKLENDPGFLSTDQIKLLKDLVSRF